MNERESKPRVRRSPSWLDQACRKLVKKAGLSGSAGLTPTGDLLQFWQEEQEAPDLQQALVEFGLLPQTAENLADHLVWMGPKQWEVLLREMEEQFDLSDLPSDPLEARDFLLPILVEAMGPEYQE